jgi:hypothetical protein
VHLLLALDLFVAVVGVDPRWLLHSLHEQHASVFPGLEDGGLQAQERSEEEAVWDTTLHDYLEKIFNIPFVLPGMTGTRFERLIRELSLGKDAPDPDDDPPPNKTEESERPADDVAPTPEVSDTSAPAPVADLPAEAGSEVATTLGVGAKPVKPAPRRLTEDELKLLALPSFDGVVFLRPAMCGE